MFVDIAKNRSGRNFPASTVQYFPKLRGRLGAAWHVLNTFSKISHSKILIYFSQLKFYFGPFWLFFL